MRILFRPDDSCNMKSVVCNLPYVKLVLNMYTSVIKSKKLFYCRSRLLYDFRLLSTDVDDYVKCTSSENLKIFNEIPGPKSYPIIGTLYKYLPLVGKLNTKNTSLDLFLFPQILLILFTRRYINIR